MITIEQVSHRYPQATDPALTNVSLQIQAGECVGLLGPNGAGKTTLMSLLAGLQAVQQGVICFEGQPLHRLSTQQRQQISLVPQDFAFYPLLSVWENMVFFASLYSIRDHARLRQLLAQTGLDEHRHKYAKNLSGGLKRRLNFAIGLINAPKLIFLDEITVGIDPESRQFILDSVAELTRQNVTVIYTSHYLQEIETLCQKICLMYQGRVVYQGAMADVLRRHGPPGLRLQTSPALHPADLAHLHGVAEANGWVAITQPRHTIADILAFLSARHYAVEAVHFGTGSLETFYLAFLQQQSAANCGSANHRDAADAVSAGEVRR